MDEIVVLSYKGEENLQLAAKLAMGSKLYHRKDWLLFQALLYPSSLSQCSLAFNSRGTVIGIMVVSLDNIMCYVRPRYRKQGIGRKLFETIKMNKKIYAIKGIEGSGKFWESLGLHWYCA
jgi:GNAT superfamily N-acetyltransferase